MIWPRYHTDIWRPGILHAPIAAVLAGGNLRDVPVTWLPAQPDFCFLADPFGLWRDGRLHVVVEAYDYRDKHGTLRCYSYTPDLVLARETDVMRAPHHLSYPFLIEDGGEIYLLPEAHRSGRLTLYRARAFPDQWDAVVDIMRGPVVDASVIHHNGRWWMFYSLDGPDTRAMRELHVAFADQLTGPWTPHPLNPVRRDAASSRPGGTPFVANGALHLPVQDCSDGYGTATHILRIDTLTPDGWACTRVRTLVATDVTNDMTDGLHTLSACGDVTLFDVKRIDRSPRRALINLQRRWRRLLARRPARP